MKSVRIVAAPGLVVGLLFAAAVPVQAQEREVLRKTFPFVSSSLTIEVAARAPGVLRITRGAVGEVTVSAQAEDGFAGAGLAEDQTDDLYLTAVGADRVEYLVIVPAETRVTVRLPDRPVSEVFGALDEVASYSWSGPDGDEPPGAGARAEPESRSAVMTRWGLYRVYSGAVAPQVVAVAEIGALRTISVRQQGDRFRIEASRPLQLSPGSADVLEIHPPASPMDLVVVLPKRATPFLLTIGGDPALLMLDDRAVALCEPVMEQQLADGRHWFTFTPDDGRLTCEAPTGPAASAVRRSRV